jgi:adenosylcobalamin-dependent ribonucleoside-triphosphate reductase
MSEFLSFKLSESFIEEYKTKKVDWKFDIGGGNTLSELTFLLKYSRKKEDGTKEQWWEVCQRCIEGMYSILKDHCTDQRTPWNDLKAQKSARDAYDRMFHFKWTPPGRGLEHMGTAFVHVNKNAGPLQNCGFISTEKLSSHSAWEATGPFIRMMEMSMNGIGIGFDLRGADKITLIQPEGEPEKYVVQDTRESWAESVGALLETYFFKNRAPLEFNYDLIRPKGAPLSSFGGTASGYEPLEKCHETIRKLLDNRGGQTLTSRDIVDIMNLIGKAVVAGGIRRTAEICFGEVTDSDYINIKNFNLPENKDRMGYDGWGWTSNNSVFATVGMDYSEIVDSIIVNGEPGLMWLDEAQQYGRMVDGKNGKDYRALGGNPCLEQTLEPWEVCTLVETFPTNHESFEDYRETLKHAYLYGKAVTLMPTVWPETNAVMNRNRRIGTSMTGLAEFVETRGWAELRTWMDEGYQFLEHRDKKYSEWLAVRESIKMTSIKPSGTVSLIAGVTPGVHWPTYNSYIRRIRFNTDNPLLPIIEKAGYKIEKSVDDPDNTMIAEFPTTGPTIRNEREVSVWEKAELASMCQRWWADNQVSATLSFMPEEAESLKALLTAKDGQFKGVSFLPIDDDGTVYQQAPYEPLPDEKIKELQEGVKKFNKKAMYKVQIDNDGDRFCDGDTCLI